MNLITLLGAAAGCREFCRLLFDDPARAAELLGLVLTEGDIALLQSSLGALTQEERDKLCNHLGIIADMVCKRPPCPFVPQIRGLEDLCKKAA